jgi:putative oxidoreductase
MQFNRWIHANKDIGILLIRCFTGARLIYGVADNIFSWNHMLAFRDFLHSFGFPFPLACAVLSVYAQFIAGGMIIIGWKIRLAALLMIVNFLVAILAVHLNDTVEAMTPALALLFINVLFVFQGRGKYSIDKQ